MKSMLLAQRVSILARLLRRAQPPSHTHNTHEEFCFNPRPTVTPGATQRAFTEEELRDPFQSSPDCYAGRNGRFEKLATRVA